MRMILTLLGMTLMANVSNADPIAWPKPTSERAKVEGDGNGVVTGSAEKTVTTLLVLDNVKVPSHQYRLSGKIKFEKVQGDAYIELLNRIPGKGEFFTRTLGVGGGMGKLNGTSDWRDLELPFFSEPGLLPDRLTVNVVLPGAGTVWFSPLTLDEVSGNPFQANSLGALLGVLLGIGGALLGILGGMPATRPVAAWMACGLFILGLALLTIGLVAWLKGTPSVDWYSLLLAGVIASLVGGIGYVTLRHRVSQDEIRKMQAMDVGA